MVVSEWDPWNLDDTESIRQRYTKHDVKRGQTELIQCRADSFQVRRIDEILACRIEPVFKTRSDVLQDAICMWLEDWDRRYPDGVTGELAYQARMHDMARRRAYREEFMESATNQLDGLRHDGDARGLSEFLHIVLRARGELQDSAPPSYMQRLDRIIETARRLLEEHRAH